jgi:hypothetical protein
MTIFPALRTAALLLAMLLGAASSPSASAQSVERSLRSSTPGGAQIFARVPAGWQAGGPLVVVNHGYSLGFDDSPSLGPLAELLLSQGYAVAASGYRTGGWALFVALDDNVLMIERFSAEFGAPGQLFAVGGSMGGLTSLKMAEDPRFAPRLAGAYSLCPPADGLRAWDSGFDLRMIYDAVCDGVGGGELLTGDAPLAWALNLSDIALNVDLTDRNDPALRTLARITQCTGVTLPSFLRTSPQRDRLRQIQALSGIDDEEFLLTNLGYSVFGMSELVRAPDKLAGSNPFDNTGARYVLALPPAEQAASTIDGRVERIAGDPFARLALAHSSQVNGNASVPIMSLHTSGDQLVPAWHQRQLRGWYAHSDAANLVQGIVVESERSHCDFRAPELEAGWNALRQWVADGRKPSVAEVQQRCLGTASAASECRIDATASLPQNLPAPLPTNAAPDARFAHSGVWFDPRRDGEGLFIEELDGSLNTRDEPQRRRVALSWYTYAPGADSAGAQRWITGVGVAHGNGVVIEDAVLVFDGRLGAATPVRRVPFGRIEIVFDRDIALNSPAASTARLRWQGPPGWGSGELVLRRLVWARSGLSDPALAAASPAIDTGSSRRSGIYYDPARDGQGFVLHQQQGAAGQPARSFLAFFTFDANGNPLWLLGVDGVSANGRIVFDPVTTTRGARFDAFEPAQVQRLRWGRLELEYSGCDITAVNWRADDPRQGNGRMAVQRIVARRGAATGCTPD